MKNKKARGARGCADIVARCLEAGVGRVMHAHCADGSMGAALQGKSSAQITLHGFEPDADLQKKASVAGYRRVWREDYSKNYWRRRGYDFYLLEGFLDKVEPKLAIRIVKTIRRREPGSQIVAVLNSEGCLFDWPDELVSEQLGLQLCGHSGTRRVFALRPTKGEEEISPEVPESAESAE